MSDLARALVASLDDPALDQLARLLAPRLAGIAATPATLTVEQAAAAANVSTRTIRRALNAGLLAGRQVAGRWKTTADDLSAWQAAGGSTAAGAPLRGHAAARRSCRSQVPSVNGADAILGAGRVDR